MLGYSLLFFRPGLGQLPQAAPSPRCDQTVAVGKWFSQMWQNKMGQANASEV